MGEAVICLMGLRAIHRQFAIPLHRMSLIPGLNLKDAVSLFNGDSIIVIFHSRGAGIFHNRIPVLLGMQEYFLLAGQILETELVIAIAPFG